MIRTVPFKQFVAALLALPMLAGCGSSDDRALDVALIASPDSVYRSGLRISPMGQLYRGATQQGLVGFDELGRVVPALAESWIVTDDGQSYIFRLRTGPWNGDEAPTAKAVTAVLKRRIAELENTSLGRDLAIIRDVRAMAGRVVEIRLRAPMPQFLALMAQAELGLTPDGAEAIGALTARLEDNVTILTETSPDRLGLPVPRRWEDSHRPIRLYPLTAQQAVDRFAEARLDLVLGGTIASLPLAPDGALTRGTVRYDGARGVLGLKVARTRGFLALPQQREALSMALDRQALIEAFGIGGWEPRAALVPPDLTALTPDQRPAWADLPLAERRVIASRRVADWRRGRSGGRLELTLAMPQGPGAEELFDLLAADLLLVGIHLKSVREGVPADLAFIDRVERYSDARWYLDQLSCAASRLACSSLADSLIDDALAAGDAADRVRLLGEAEAELAAADLLIVLGNPVRWSLVRADITGFEPNTAALHPLSPMARVPR